MTIKRNIQCTQSVFVLKQTFLRLFIVMVMLISASDAWAISYAEVVAAYNIWKADACSNTMIVSESSGSKSIQFKKVCDTPTAVKGTVEKWIQGVQRGYYANGINAPTCDGSGFPSKVVTTYYDCYYARFNIQCDGTVITSPITYVLNYMYCGGVAGCDGNNNFIANGAQCSVTTMSQVYSSVNGGPEICDGQDNDGDGVIDNGFECKAGDAPKQCYEGLPGTEGVSSCHGGTQMCKNCQWDSTCYGQVLPGEEKCDGKDGNCDGNSKCQCDDTGHGTP